MIGQPQRRNLGSPKFMIISGCDASSTSGLVFYFMVTPKSPPLHQARLSQLLYCCPSDVSSPNLRSAAELKASALPALLILPTKPPDRLRGAQRSRQRPWGGHTTKSRIE
ncbi:hypothetical protein SRHO_G00309730 [Serrasalmus rhombeus]